MGARRREFSGTASFCLFIDVDFLLLVSKFSRGLPIFNAPPWARVVVPFWERAETRKWRRKLLEKGTVKVRKLKKVRKFKQKKVESFKNV